MNWKRIAIIALALFVAQFSVGFLDGLLSPTGASVLWPLFSGITSFVICTAIFAFFATLQAAKPFAHAWAGLMTQVAVAVVLASALSFWLGGTDWPVVAMEWLVLIGALVVGTSVGSAMRRGNSKPADA